MSAPTETPGDATDPPQNDHAVMQEGPPHHMNRASFRITFHQPQGAEPQTNAATATGNNDPPENANNTAGAGAAPPSSPRNMGTRGTGRRIQIHFDGGRGGRGGGGGGQFGAGRIPIRATVNGRPQPVRMTFNDPRNGNNRNRPGQPPPPPNQQLRLPSLQPHVLPESRQEFDSNNNDAVNDNDIDDNFKCSICYDIMNDPAGCGKCSARFCYACLKRVTEMALQRQNQRQQQPGRNSPAPPRCPVCRSEMADPEEDIQRDGELRRRIQELPPVPCRYQGCQERVLIHQLGSHETTCPHVKVQCRYQMFGCPWTGKRLDIQAHEEQDCNLARVSDLVEKLREMQLRMSHLHQSVMANGSMMEFQRIRMQQEHNQVSTANIFNLLHFIHLISCCTPRFLTSKDMWSAFHSDPRGRAAVNNFATMLPTIVLILKTLAVSYNRMIAAVYHLDSDEKLLEFAEGCLYTMVFMCMAFLVGLCFFTGGGTSDMWQKMSFNFSLPTASGELRRAENTHILQYTVVAAMVATHSLAFDSLAYTLRITLVWVWLCLTSTVFPAAITIMSIATNTANTAVNDHTMQLVFQTGRAARPIWFSLCYAPCLAFGILPCLDAAIILYLGRDVLQKVTVVERVLAVGEGEKFGNPLANAPLPLLWMYTGARLAIRAAEFPSSGWFESFDFLAVALMVVTTKVVLWKNMQVGVHFGLYIMNEARRRINSGFGVAIASVWCILLGAIAIT